MTDDGFVYNVRAFVRDKQGDILMLHESRYNRRTVPWGKVDINMTLEQALDQEIEEELWVSIVSKKWYDLERYIWDDPNELISGWHIIMIYKSMVF